ncbi:DUF3551 domain-containing protein [Bradyrhizobium jicamae]|uniref:DUF3551 domain-containing protein n=1 Tax=Bradyrhizobium jicamae TaxID=280332 RepID=UPI003221A993
MPLVAMLLLVGATSALAQDYPWCLQGRDWGYPGLCHFWTYGQCRATASGTFAYCGINPRFAFAPQRPGYRPWLAEPSNRQR